VLPFPERSGSEREDTVFSVARLPAVCDDDVDDRRSETDPDHTTFVRVGLRCDGQRVTAFSMDWSDWN
jgi:hypothetical protein